MHRYALIAALLPAVWGCANPDSNSCASYISAHKTVCPTYLTTVITATTGLPSWASNCSNKPSQISKECSCYTTVTGGGGGGTTLTTTTTTGGGGATTTTTTGPTTSATGGGGTGTVPVDGLFGYGAGTTGGGSASGVTVTSCSALSSAVSGTSAKVIRINGMLSGCGIMDVGSNTSIFGVGSNSGFTGAGFRVKGGTNVIFRNLKLGPPPPGGDVLATDTSTKIWVDHCELKSVGITGDKDYYDGLLDLTHASDLITVSWTKFHDHWKGSLVGHSDSNASEDTGHLRVTYHHNQWVNVNSRLPSLRFGTGHVYNSHFSNCPTSGINSRMGANVLVQNSVFDNVPLAMVTDLDSDEEGKICNSGNVLTGTSTTRITQTCSLTPPYSYSLDAASTVVSRVAAYAGVGIVAP